MTLNEFYTILGGSITWGIIGGLSGYALFWICVIVYGGYLKVRNKNFIAFYIFKDNQETEHLRDWYYQIRKRMTFQEFDKLNRKTGRYLSKYRLRNIKSERFAWPT